METPGPMNSSAEPGSTSREPPDVTRSIGGTSAPLTDGEVAGSRYTAEMADIEAGPGERDGDPNAHMVFTVGLIGAILMLALLIFGVVLFQNVQALETEEKVFAGRPVELTQQQTLQLAAISEYRYISEADGVVAIPIDRAIDLFVARVREDPRQASPVAPASPDGQAQSEFMEATPDTQPAGVP